MDDSQYLVRLPDRREFGPVDMPGLERWAREGRVPADAVIVTADAADTPPRRVMEIPRLATIVGAPPTVAGPATPEEGGRLIPYKNPPALIAYYLGLFSLLPFLGIALAVPAFILGIVGLRKRTRNPEVHGAAHAWIGIIMGGLLTLVWGGSIILMLFGAVGR